jgi:hypothetical protein
MKNKLSLSELVLLIDEKHRFSIHTILTSHADKINLSPGSLSKHQAWQGGYKDHLEETMNFAIQLFNLMNKERELPFSLSDCLLVLFLHDIEKPFKYTGSDIPLHTEEEKWLFIKKIVNDYRLFLNEAHWNALQYIHGEGKDYDPTKRIQQPLAAFVHICDVASARIWYDYPKK